jgi:signal transduction histidine kinase
MRNAQSAVLNILEDAEEDKRLMRNTQSAVLNILEDAEDDKHLMRNTQSGVLNILEDAEDDKHLMRNTQSGVLNILEDAEEDKRLMRNTQSAVLNILEDAEDDKHLMRNTQSAALNILEDSEGDKRQLRDAQSTVLNIRDDIDAEREERKRAEQEVRRLNENLERLVTQRTAALLAANQELEAFAYSVSHDLRAPLRAINGFSTVIVEDYDNLLDQAGKDALLRIRLAAQQMGLLIDDMTLSRSTRGMIDLGTVNLSSIADSVAETMTESSPMRVTFSVGASIRALGDPVLCGPSSRICFRTLVSFQCNRPHRG